MFKRFFLISIYVLCFLMPAKTINAGKGIKSFGKIQNDNRSNVPLPGNCPNDEILKNNTEWIEHNEEWNDYLDNILKTHFSLPLTPVKPTVYLNLIPIYVDRGTGAATWREIVWAVNRTNQINYIGKNNNCYIVGMAAYYVEGENTAGWPPDIRFLKNPEAEEKWLREGAISLIELRWYDAVKKKRHRWFNRRLASALDWVDGYYYSPIFLPWAINTLN